MRTSSSWIRGPEEVFSQPSCGRSRDGSARSCSKCGLSGVGRRESTARYATSTAGSLGRSRKRCVWSRSRGPNLAPHQFAVHQEQALRMGHRGRRTRPRPCRHVRGQTCSAARSRARRTRMCDSHRSPRSTRPGVTLPRPAPVAAGQREYAHTALPFRRSRSAAIQAKDLS